MVRIAHRLPFDGMNSKGVAVAMAAVPTARSGSGKATGSLGVMRLVLDRAASVGEAVAIFRRTAVDFSDGPPLHYMVADASGESAVVEYVDGRVQVISRGARPWQAMTNFVLTGAHGVDHRYRAAGPPRRLAYGAASRRSRRSTCSVACASRSPAGRRPMTSAPASSTSSWARSSADAS